MKTVTQEDIRAIHSRLDVHKQAIEKLAYFCAMEIGHSGVDFILDMLEESQNPFEVSDETDN